MRDRLGPTDLLRRLCVEERIKMNDSLDLTTAEEATNMSPYDSPVPVARLRKTTAARPAHPAIRRKPPCGLSSSGSATILTGRACSTRPSGYQSV